MIHKFFHERWGMRENYDENMMFTVEVKGKPDGLWNDDREKEREMRPGKSKQWQLAHLITHCP